MLDWRIMGSPGGSSSSRRPAALALPLVPTLEYPNNSITISD